MSSSLPLPFRDRQTWHSELLCPEKDLMIHFLIPALVVAVMATSLMIMIEAGRRFGIYRKKSDPDTADAGISTVDGAIYGLLGLVIAFTFSGAATRFDHRRDLVTQEANAIGTAFLRVDLLPPAMQPAIKQDFRDYLDARLAFYRAIPDDPEGLRVAQSKYTALQEKIWSESVAGCKEAGSPATTSLVLSSLNDMIDITTTRAVAAEMHPPWVIFLALLALALTGAFLAGYGTAGAKKRNWAHMFIFAGVMSLAIYMILDLEFPRLGLIRVNAIDHVLQDTRNTM